MQELYYEKKQNQNKLTRFLHSRRYKNIERFVSESFHGNGPLRVLDIGCGPGGAFNALRDVYRIDYTGIDIREDFIDAARSRYGDGANGSNCRFEIEDVANDGFDFSEYDLIIALETFEHIPENRVVRCIERIAAARPKYLLCSVPIEIGPSVAIKNAGSMLFGYHRGSGNFRETMMAAAYNLNALPPHGTDHLGFNWIWLEQTLRHNLRIIRSQSLPFWWLPKNIAPTVMFVCEPYA